MTDERTTTQNDRPMQLSTHRQLELFRDLQRLANSRQEAETRIANTYRTSVDAAQKLFKKQTADIEKTCSAAREQSQQSHDEALAAEESRYASLRDVTQAAYQNRRNDIESHWATTVEAAKSERKQSAWQTLAVFDASKGTPKLRLEEIQTQLRAQEQEVASLKSEARQILDMRNLGALASDLPQPPATTDGVDVSAAVESLRAEVTRLWDDNSTKWLEGGRPWMIGAVLVLLPIIPLGLTLEWTNWITYVVGNAIGAVLAVVTTRMLTAKAKAAAFDRLQAIGQALSNARATLSAANTAALEHSRVEASNLLAVRDRDLSASESLAKQKRAEIEVWKSKSLEEASAKFPSELTAMRAEHQQKLATIEKTHHDQVSTITNERSDRSKAASEAKKVTLEAVQSERDHDWQLMHDEWQSGYAAVRDELAAMKAVCDRLAPDWRKQSFAEWDIPTEAALAIPIGEATLSLAKVKSAISGDQRLRPQESELTIPTLLHLAEQPTLVVTAPAALRSRATGILQSILVRFLTAMPPGKVRLTLCDPVGLGESFSAFMHLADYDETLIASRIWTQPRDIDEQLLRLSTHMETILQKYLRDEYESIHEYNAQAGEVAEPFQVLAIADFPHGISDTSMKRLLSLAKGGPRCGIYVLLSLDLAQRIAGDVPLDSLTEGAVHLDWDTKSDRFVWRYPAFEHLPLKLPEPLPADRLVPLLKQVGQAAQDAIKVEVPFGVVAPKGPLWQETCDSELRVPIGRAGANRLQYVRLGKGTSQHLLVAGKTGSGKSTFLHALVTSAALHFSPREVEFYLVDFKKGVEFKSYATQQLPHARVIAIESEREFGISVLERLDGILRERGEKFRASGVQSLADYRAAHPKEAMPRILLVVDEFQELFVEDDKLASQASLLLDRLIRQGRAFGMHVVLGSQTLAGAYSLARATLGQMAVRVALQCSETDAHLILSDERNQAARFLSRPGEAIYNDQNGMASANEPFQVVWLPDAERSDYLGSVRDEAKSEDIVTAPPIVFEGNAPSDPRENKQLVKVLGGKTPNVPRAWLGAAVSIGPPTQVEFHRHAGSNLVIVGQNEPIALGVLTTATVALIAAPKARIDVIDGSRAGEPGESAWKMVSDALGVRVRVSPAADATTIVAELATEVARRESESDESAPPRFLIIHNAARARELRKSDDDFGFSFTKEESAPSAGKQFVDLLKNGPTWGIHTLLWCDNYNALTRLMDRVTLREFDHRVVLQMSAGDSSNLIDTPAASRLTEHRALLYSDETGESEKFRPYEVPRAEWLESLRDDLKTTSANWS